MAGSSQNSNILPGNDELIPLPRSSRLLILPKRIPVGYDPERNKFVVVSEYNGMPVYAVSAFMPPGYIRTLNASYIELHDAPVLPLYCYSAAGFKNGRFFSAGYRIDNRMRHTITESKLSLVRSKAGKILKLYPHNRLVSHLVNNCVFKYSCPNAFNFILQRSECPIPVSGTCNSECVGCISKQDRDSGFPASQERIDFTPTVQEILEYVIPHLEKAADPIISFGQGCEGEPLLKSKLIEETILAIRSRTRRGVININTNASIPDSVERLCKAGLDSIRISLNSARRHFYDLYYRPGGYTFNDVLRSMKIAKKFKVWLSINYLVFPGFTDTHQELYMLKKLIRERKINMIQTRNLNIDPALFNSVIMKGNYSGKPIGIINWVKSIKNDFPDLELGYFNPTLKTIRKYY